MLKSLIKNKFNLFIVLVYISICLSVSAKSFDILFILKPELNFISIINFSRSIISSIVLLIFIGFITWNFCRKKKIEIDIMLKLFFIFIFIEIIGGINNPKIYEHLYEYDIIFKNYTNKTLISSFINFDQNYYLICLCSILLFFLIINSFLKNFKIEYLLLISFIIFFSYNVVLIFNIYNSFLLSNDFSTYGTLVTAPSNIFFNHSVPRITGVSRLLLFFYIILTCYTFFILKKKTYTKVSLMYLFIIFTGSLIWSFQSRTILLAKIIIDILLVFFLQKKINNKIVIFLILTFFPIILHNSIIIFKNKESRYLFLGELNLLYQKIYKKNNNDINLNNNLIIKKNRIFNENTSGRTEIWNEIIIKSKDSLLFGHGSQADRWYINRDESFYNNASSAFFYALICGGLSGVLIYILIFYRSLKLVFFIFLKNKFFFKKNNLLTVSSFFILISLLLRSLVENSFMLFSIDNIFFLTCYYILIKKVKQSL
jgi:hypothetical protein